MVQLHSLMPRKRQASQLRKGSTGQTGIRIVQCGQHITPATPRPSILYAQEEKLAHVRTWCEYSPKAMRNPGIPRAGGCTAWTMSKDSNNQTLKQACDRIFGRVHRQCYNCAKGYRCVLQLDLGAEDNALQTAFPWSFGVASQM